MTGTVKKCSNCRFATPSKDGFGVVYDEGRGLKLHMPVGATCGYWEVPQLTGRGTKVRANGKG